MRRPRSIYLAGRAVDFLCAGVASLLAFAVLKALQGRVSDETVTSVSLGSFYWVVNGMHFSATNYRLYRSSESIAQYPLTAAAVPAVVLAAVAAALRWPAVVAPAFIKLFLLWSPYHYSGQTRGLSMLYARRSGFEPPRWAWLALSGFIFGTYVVSVARADSGLGRADFFGVKYPSLGLPPAAAPVLETLMWACGAVFLAGCLLWCRKARRGVPAIVLVPAAAQCLWFLPGPGLPPFYLLVPFFHGLQYLVVAWFMQVQERAGQPRARPSRSWLASETSQWLALNLAGYGALFWAFPKLVAAVTGAPPLFALPVAIAGVQIHHFFVDGVIWKLRNPRVASPMTADLPL